MPTNYLNEFPIKVDTLPEKLRGLLEPVGTILTERVEVSTQYENDPYGPNKEAFHMLMAAVPDDTPSPLPLLDDDGGVVSYSVPVLREKGDSKDFLPSISGYEYIVASWGDGSFYTYNLAEKVWMALGLTPRCVGNEHQRLIYDDLGLPEFGVAEGEVSGDYHWQASRNISWKMSNEYLRKYLWMRGARGVRVFFYESLLQDTPQLRALMGGEKHVEIKPQDGWYLLDIREHKGGLLIQVWATVEAVSVELCSEQSANGIYWPDVPEPMTHDRANALLSGPQVYLNDQFLERYEQSKFYDTTPANIHGHWSCSPSYKGQWAFTDCVRVGRNIVSVPMRELYKPKPDREILHAHSFALNSAEVAHFDLDEEHIVSKTQRLLNQLLDLGDNLSVLSGSLGINKNAAELIGFSRTELKNNGWLAYPQLARLSQVAPLSMTQQAFLSRCKSLHEIWQKIPNGVLKLILQKAGCPQAAIKDFGSLRLLQALLNILEYLDANEDRSDAFVNDRPITGWNARNPNLAPLFLNNDLRIADAHETVEDSLKTLQSLGFDTATLNEGYGRALDFVMDGLIDAFTKINTPITNILNRS